MDYSFGIEQFNTLIDEIETAKQQGMLDVTGHDVEALHNKCEVLLKNVYPPNSEWGDAQAKLYLNNNKNHLWLLTILSLEATNQEKLGSLWTLARKAIFLV